MNERPPSANAEGGGNLEAHQVLMDLARGRTGAIPAESLVRHILALTAEADWPVKRAAMEAVIRRCSFGKRDRLRVAERPARGRPFGVYRTKRERSSPRPYTTLIAGVDPLRGSCDCPDYIRNSLGLCKHVLAAVNDIIARPRALEWARASQASATLGAGPALVWDANRPLTGDGDWLQRVFLLESDGDDGAPPHERLATAMRRYFAPTANGRAALRSSHVTEPRKRLALIEDLRALIDSRAPNALSAEPAVRALLETESDRLRHSQDDRIGATQVRTALRSLKRRPYPYQREGIAAFFRTGRLLLADDMGLGKTVQAIAVCHVLQTTASVQRGLLVVPASLKPQWMREWSSFTDTPIEVVDGSPAERRSLYRKIKRGFLLINYELLLRDFDQVHTWKPEIVVLDEAQRIKNWATKTATFVKRLDPPYRLVLTGTPMENRLDELASVFEWVDSFALEPKWRLTPWHTVSADGAKDVRGARNLDTLRARLAPSMLRRTRSEVLDQLPVRTDTVVPIEITAEQRDEHDALAQPIAALVGRAHRRPLTQAEFLRLMSLLTTQRIIANGLAQLRYSEIWPSLAQSPPEVALLRSLASPKLVELREILGQIIVEQGRKVVVFSQWRRMLQLANWASADILSAAGKRAVFFTGQEKQQRRTQNLVDLHDDPATCVLFATDAGGVGLNLQRAASCCINIDLPWNPAVLEQRIGRIYRLGQTQPISVYNLVTQDSIEERIAGLIADKKALFAGVFEGSSDQIDFDRSGSFLSQLERIVAPQKGSAIDEEVDDLEEEQPALERELDEIVAAADEASDPRFGQDTGATTPLAGGERRPTAPVPDAIATSDFRDLFAQLKIAPTAQGGLSIEAPPEAAATLATLFEEMAKLMRSQANG